MSGASKLGALWCVVGVATWTVGCGPPDVTGDWDGDWHLENSVFSGGVTLKLEQDGEDVTGSFDLDGTLCVEQGDVTGTLDDRELHLTLSNGSGGRIEINGKVDVGGNGIDGDFDVTGGLCTTAEGTVKLTRQ